ncbi:LOW QUALITY PROTEIN: interphotoreceptor matrix proteoglycan 2 [Microcaecilia unicolor]|uniref:Interphotoreceptor matrix proteoglycan 2 n=1 Tax=Microcaecilia unicolor TaxID=1415580 RepID=A0A6P7YDK7_9AMPH|nr:LOW QUALITY PROTEIN: interphotoreceptor matrix proteoglycan 2 [Microcaecilia unicolor]
MSRQLKQSYGRLLLRKKRAVLFPSGAKVCPEETVEQTMINHLQYFKLRVCQEIVWEAFKIFWDRLPEHEDYRIWMNLCEGGSINIFEIGTNFSHSEEHYRMIMKKLSLLKEAISRQMYLLGFQTKAAANVLPPQGTSVKNTTLNNISTQEETENSINEIEKIIEKPMKPIAEQMVEFSIHLAEEMYSEGLSDQSTKQHQKLAAQFISQVQSVFQELPGYKKIHVIEFRDGVEVHYAVIFDGDAETISNATLDLINLHSNKVEVNNFMEGEDHPTAIYTINDFRSYITDALFKKTLVGNITMTLDPQSLQLITVKEVLSSIPEEESLVTGKSRLHGPSASDVSNGHQAEWLPTSQPAINSILPLDITKKPTNEIVLQPEKPLTAEAGLTSAPDLLILEESSPTSASPSTVLQIQTFGTNQWLSNSVSFEGLGFPSQGASSLTDLDFSAEEGTFVLNENLSPDMKPGRDALFDGGSGSGFDHSGQEMDSNLWPRALSTLEPVSYSTPNRWLEDNMFIQNMDEENTNRMSIDYIVDSVNFSVNTQQEELLDTTGEEFKGKAEAFDRFIITEHTSSRPIFTETTSEQVPMLLTQEPLNVELSLQTDASEDMDDDSLTEPSVILRPTLQSLFFSILKEELSTSMDKIGLELNKTRESFWEKQHRSSSAMYPTANGASSTEDFSNSDKRTDHTNIHLIVDKTHQSIDTSEKPFIEIFTNYHQTLDSQFTAQEVTGSSVVRPHSSEPTESTINLLEKVTDQDKLLSAVTSITRKATKVVELLTTAQQASIHLEVTNKVPNVVQLTTGSEDIMQQYSIIRDAISVNDVNSTMKSVTTTIGNAKQDQTSWDSNRVDHHDQFSKVTFLHSTELIPPVILVKEDEEVVIMGVQDIAVELDQKGTIFYGPGMNQEEKRMTDENAHSTDMAGIILSSQEYDTNVTGRALVVFFSLRVTNMMFSEDLFNKNSPEYKALEQRFLELLVPYLQFNLTGFQNLEILNFRNGSIVVNSRMKFERPVPRNVTNAVYIILEDFCNTVYRTMNLAIDKHSLDVEAGEQADPCKYQACNAFSECLVNRWSGEGECICNSGHMSIDGLPCQSVCDLQPDFCLNDGKCDIIPGKGAICRCRVGENWWYRGEHCEEYVSEPLVVGIAIASVAGFLLVAISVVFFGQNFSIPAHKEGSRAICKEIQDRVRIIELYAKDQQFADFVRQHQMSLANARKGNQTRCS